MAVFRHTVETYSGKEMCPKCGNYVRFIRVFPIDTPHYTSDSIDVPCIECGHVVKLEKKTTKFVDVYDIRHHIGMSSLSKDIFE